MLDLMWLVFVCSLLLVPSNERLWPLKLSRSADYESQIFRGGGGGGIEVLTFSEFDNNVQQSCYVAFFLSFAIFFIVTVLFELYNLAF